MFINDLYQVSTTLVHRDKMAMGVTQATVYFDGKETVSIVTDDQPLTNTTCDICMEVLSSALCYSIKDCGCTFCRPCLGTYLTGLITENDIYRLSCPQNGCKGVIQPDEVYVLCDEPTFQLFSRLKYQMDVEMDPNWTFCPQVGCDTLCHICPVQGNANEPQKVVCPKCTFSFCSQCKAKWHSDNCADFATTKNKKKNSRLLTDPNAPIKRCPVCRVPIERNNGCAQMMCKRCKHVFCWYCLASLDDDFLLRHYDKGACKNKLGHSRASVIWHRAQVVSIFAGIGLLLLVVSPFLLLAAPCILCCKCKLCKCCSCCAEEGDMYHESNQDSESS